jgi:hypothetical protein
MKDYKIFLRMKLSQLDHQKAKLLLLELWDVL